MGQQNDAAVIATEIEKVREDVPTLFEMEGPFFNSIEKKKADIVSARDMRVPLKIKAGGKSGGYDPDGGDMGRGGGVTYSFATVPVVHQKMALEWTKKAQWGTDDRRKAVVNAFKDTLADAMPQFQRDIDAWAMTGGDGVLATADVYSVGTGTGGGDRITCNGATNGFRANLVRDDLNVNVFDTTLATNKTLGSERSINYWDVENFIFDIFPSVAAGLATDKIVVSGVTTAPPVWLLGVPYHHNGASTGTWLGLSRVTNPQIRASQVAAGGALALPFPRLALNKIANRLGQSRMEKVQAWMHLCQKAAYEELGQLVSIIQKAPADEKLNLYFGDGMQMAGAPVKTSPKWDRTRIDFVNTDVWGRAEMTPIGFYTTSDGRKFFEVRGTSGGVVSAELIYLKVGFNMFVNNPSACSYISGLTIPSGY